MLAKHKLRLINLFSQRQWHTQHMPHMDDTNIVWENSDVSPCSLAINHAWNMSENNPSVMGKPNLSIIVLILASGDPTKCAPCTLIIEAESTPILLPQMSAEKKNIGINYINIYTFLLYMILLTPIQWKGHFTKLLKHPPQKFGKKNHTTKKTTTTRRKIYPVLSLFVEPCWRL